MNYEEEILKVKRNVLLARARQAADELSDENPPATKAEIIVKIPSSIEATLLLHPTSPRTEPPTKEELLAALEEKGIVHGVNMELIDDLSAKPVYYHVFTIARGEPATAGRDGYLNYLVSQTVDHAPVIGEDGTADYKNINLFRVVKKDQPLCEVFAAERGEDGMDIYGNVLEGKYGAPPFDPAGLNTAYNEEQTLVCSLIDGHVAVQYGKINVVEVLTIPANVGTATGNIEFTGDVIVGGDVASGFSIKCGGSIVVGGSVEGALLDAGTDISVSVGMLGLDRGCITAGGNIKCKFIQNCTVRAAGSIYADSILFSNVECKGDLILGGRKGALIGGSASVSGKLLAKTIGSSMHPQTEVNMCAPGAETLALIRELEEEIRRCGMEISAILQTIARFEEKGEAGHTPEETKDAIMTAKRYQEVLTQREIAETKLAEATRKMVEDGKESSYIICKDKIHTNAILSFGRDKMRVETTHVNCKIKAADDGIEVLTP